ncbi:PEP-CTERM sorting domain-containing protein [Coraliomargarita sp. SDUM461003]|uniref:PEP-CTERM sorting domain-containing protein n=1 Tax=Thalassobacterium maritimum TaxID=3041265 RepID=A0ABU1AV73_9BACT|nr:PEP-CTERM sorting domain-containing protein [Coraliomargarita sp. SDUM461003]MDQ8208048.1 PEP-CTERM sorting domain-containing protein [Coraliomargarita sp. SDUM461003]
MKNTQSLLTLFAASAMSLQAASFTDTGADASNFASFGNMVSSSDGDLVSLTRTDSGGDAGADWYIGASTRLSLFEVDQQNVLNITPSAQIGDGQWQVNILFFDSLGDYINEKNLIAFSNSTAGTSDNIADFATSEGIVGAESYYVRFRTQGDVNSGFSFTEVAAVPEPSQSALMFGGLALVSIFLRRRHRD